MASQRLVGTINTVSKNHVNIRLVERGTANQPRWQRLGWPRSVQKKRRVGKAKAWPGSFVKFRELCSNCHRVSD